MSETEIKVARNGPYRVSGTFRLLDAAGHEIPCDEEILLCRCGHSSDKPFCDGSHREFHFESVVLMEEE